MNTLQRFALANSVSIAVAFVLVVGIVIPVGRPPPFQTWICTSVTKVSAART
jgi:hypothetical protein